MVSESIHEWTGESLVLRVLNRFVLDEHHNTLFDTGVPAATLARGAENWVDSKQSPSKLHQFHLGLVLRCEMQ